jgi:Bacterial lectin
MLTLTRRGTASRCTVALAVLGLGLITGTQSSSAATGLPKIESFADPTTTESWTLLDDAALVSRLRLTPDVSDKRGGAFLDEALSASPGLQIDFDAQVSSSSWAPGDGYTLALIDGSSSTPTLGAGGGGAGYNASGDEPGLSNAYLAVGFDAYGNFTGSGPGFAVHRATTRGSG